jgi:UDP-N-acetylmuramoyl-tripeptide--D-alanyl-D-alanine ligase
MGINHPDEMRHLAVMVRPTIAVFTVMGHAHLEFLKSPEGVFREKTSMLNYMRDDAVAVVNGDDPLLDKLVCRQRIIRYGLHSNADVMATNIVPNGNSIDCRITYLDRELHAEIPGFGNHMVYAALEAASVGFVLGLDDDQIIKGIRSFKALEGRSNLIETSYISLIDDCYNANPDSARSSLDSMCNFKGRKVFIFGDMLELGENTKSMHADIGRYANGRADLLITVGMLSYNAYEAFEGPKQSFVTTDELLLKLDGLIEKGDTVLIKASRDSALFKVRDALKELGGGNSDG